MQFISMHPFHQWQQIWHERFLAASTEADLRAVLAQVASALGFDYCALGMRMPLPLSNPKVVMLSNYPSAWREHYAEAMYLAVDPTVAHALASNKPMLWSDEVFVNARELWNDARDHDLRVGWAQPVHDLKGVASLLTLARSREAISPMEMGDRGPQMVWLAHTAHEALAKVIAARSHSPARIKLSAREVDVLRWAGDGKTAAETASILNIAERTVIFHIDNAMRKLGATNKTAGVLKAAMLRLI
jgi:LuxR family transcriptional regulator, quorum-sensing system regulator SolR